MVIAGFPGVQPRSQRTRRGTERGRPQEGTTTSHRRATKSPANPATKRRQAGRRDTRRQSPQPARATTRSQSRRKPTTPTGRHPEDTANRGTSTTGREAQRPPPTRPGRTTGGQTSPGRHRKPTPGKPGTPDGARRKSEGHPRSTPQRPAQTPGAPPPRPTGPHRPERRNGTHRPPPPNNDEGQQKQQKGAQKRPPQNQPRRPEPRQAAEKGQGPGADWTGAGGTPGTGRRTLQAFERGGGTGLYLAWVGSNGAERRDFRNSAADDTTAPRPANSAD